MQAAGAVDHRVGPELAGVLLGRCRRRPCRSSRTYMASVPGNQTWRSEPRLAPSRPYRVAVRDRRAPAPR